MSLLTNSSNNNKKVVKTHSELTRSKVSSRPLSIGHRNRCYSNALRFLASLLIVSVALSSPCHFLGSSVDGVDTQDSTANTAIQTQSSKPETGVSHEELRLLRTEYFKYKILYNLGLEKEPDSDVQYSPDLLTSTEQLRKQINTKLEYNSEQENQQQQQQQQVPNGENLGANQAINSSSDITTTSLAPVEQGQLPFLFDPRLDKLSSSVDTEILSREAEHGQSDHSVRSKRSVECGASRDERQTCCRESFYVNFTEIGWSKWIVHPPGYYANYCRGQCDLSHSRYYHSSILSKYPNVISLCCSPRKMSHLSLVYVDQENQVHQKTMIDMVVDSCDCA